MLEVFVRGQGTPFQLKESPLPALFQELGEGDPDFVATARLFCVLLLRLTGVVEHIIHLSLTPIQGQLAVNFEGRRARRYGNVDPAVIAVNGLCRLA